MTIKIGVIVGSNRPARMGRQVADWYMKQIAETADVEFELIDLADLKLPFLDEPNPPMMGSYQEEHTKKWSARVEALDGFVFVTPEYNHGYPAALKNAVDYLHSEWGKKPVAFVGYGAMGAIASIEQLVNITAQLQMVPQPSSALKIIDIWTAFNDVGELNPGNLRGNLGGHIDNLVWWAKTLQAVRKG